MEWRVVLGIVVWQAITILAATPDQEKNGEVQEDTNSIEYILEHPEHPMFYPVAWNDSDYKMIKATEDMVKKIMPMVIRSSSEIDLSGPCMASLFKMILAIKKQKMWAYNSM